MSNPPAPPEDNVEYVEDAELFETLDLLSTVVASISDRVDSQTRAIDQLTKTAAETRQAAFAARSQTDPQLFADHSAVLVSRRMTEPLEVHERVMQELSKQIDKVRALNHEHVSTREQLLQRLRQDRQSLQRWKKGIMVFAATGLVLGLVLGAVLPRFMADYPLGCSLIGGQMLVPDSGSPACALLR